MTQRTEGHVIPESIGGRLSASNLCKQCNSDMGVSEALLARDISVRLLVDKLEDRLPEGVVTSIRYRQDYFIEHEEYGRVEAGMDKRAELRLKESPTIKSDENTIKQAYAELTRLGASDEQKADFLARFERAESGDWIDVRPGYRIRRAIDWTDAEFAPSLTDPITPLHVPVGIAYLYLAICLGDRVYQTALDPVRAALRAAMRGEAASADAYCAESRHGTGIVEPKHLLRARADGEGVSSRSTCSATFAGRCASPASRLLASRRCIGSISNSPPNGGRRSSRRLGNYPFKPQAQQGSNQGGQPSG